MTDNEFNLELNKKILYYRENAVATVYNYIGKDQLCFCSDMHAVHSRHIYYVYIYTYILCIYIYYVYIIYIMYIYILCIYYIYIYIMYIYVVNALHACHCKSKADLCLYSYINSCYSIFTVIQYFFI